MVFPPHGGRASHPGPRLRQRQSHRHGIPGRQASARRPRRGPGWRGPSPTAASAGRERHRSRGGAAEEPARGALHGLERLGGGLRLLPIPGPGLWLPVTSNPTSRLRLKSHLT